MIVVTTPTGNIGQQVLTNLLEEAAPVRVVARDPTKLPEQTRGRVEVVRGSHGDADVVARAFEGADAVFWLPPPDYRTPDLAASYLDFTRPASDIFQRHQSMRVVGVSALGRGSALARKAGLVSASLAMDDLIAGTGVRYRSLALPSFMDNLLRQAAAIGSQGVFFLPLDADRRLPTCATRDIASVATRLLLDTSWSGQDSVAVLGPEDLSGDDMARIMSEVLARPIRFQSVSDEDFRMTLGRQGMSEAMVQGMAEMMLAKNSGLDNAEPRTPRADSPTSFRAWCQDVLGPAVSASKEGAATP
ncbi:NmrA family transcriptional regulator [Parafrankia colletiae]|uniref:NmrA family transcriptional regulator n=1 Tax=Parafrankia colletiae TaxID=573497 RepID=A0A1S1R8S3_9ACTN|nr:NAD(P)H-binding protein [Parafrankia colletiae]MCK9901553.1 NAD(P)H-binding protein [Frankia sp. Cpl3]OHV41124.1 NmrA family transcriptional regulator [Parafrankia colletiae]